MKLRRFILVICISLPVLAFAENKPINLNDTSVTEDQEIKHWQLIAGYSINNTGIYNIEVAYLIPFKKILFDLSASARIYSFPAFNFNILLHPIKISNKFNISLCAGFGVSPNVLFGIIGHTFGELSCIVRYKLSENYNLFVHYKRVGTNESGKLATFTDKYASRFPIQFFSIGLEI